MIKKGEIVYGKITNILGYGAFAVIGEYDGLIHISEVSDYYVHQIEDYLKVGQKVKLKVLDVDEEKKQLKLSYKKLHKSRGIKGEIPDFEIGFQSLEKIMPEFINNELNREEEDND